MRYAARGDRTMLSLRVRVPHIPLLPRIKLSLFPLFICCAKFRATLLKLGGWRAGFNVAHVIPLSAAIKQEHIQNTITKTTNKGAQEVSSEVQCELEMRTERRTLHVHEQSTCNGEERVMYNCSTRTASSTYMYISIT